MALPSQYLETFTAEEISFRSEDELVSIIANRNIPPIHLAGWDTPALRPLRQAQVPIWLALLLKKQGRCAIVFPDWMDEASLQEFVEKERSEPGFSALPWLWQPISHQLLAAAPDDHTGDVDVVRQLLQDLRELRQAKINKGISLVNESHMQMDQLGLMELNEVRPVLARSMATLQKIRP